MPNLNLYAVLYQIRKPAPAPTGTTIAPGNLYTKEVTHAVVLSADGGPSALAVLKSNLTLASGEVIDLLRSQQAHAAGIGGVLS